jgi:competence ComEA-like helix-hairpin-helix protein
MRRLQRLQQRLSITRNESLTLLSLSALLILGLGVRHIQQRTQPVRPDAYEEVDRMFAELSGRIYADSSYPATGTGTPASRNDTDLVRDAPDDRQEAQTGIPIGQLDLNRATAGDLETLPRIGPATAQRIVSHRTTFGPFSSVDDLDAVKGIGPKTLELLRPHLYVRQDSTASPPHAPEPGRDLPLDEGS